MDPNLEPAVFQYQGDVSPDALKILFVGNSLIFTNDLPLVLLDLLKARREKPKTGISLERGFKFYSVVQGGFRLEDHWNYKIASQCIKEGGPWDYVILQEQSVATADTNYDISRYSQLFAEEIKAAGAKIAWFVAWSYCDEPEANKTAAVRQAELAAKLQATKMPAGDCWARSQEKNPGIKLYMDQIHPSPAGTYLAACAFYAVLTGLSPIGLPFEVKNENGYALIKLKALQGLALQEVARDVVFG